MKSPYTRLESACIFTDGARELEARLAKVDQLLPKGNAALKDAVKEMQATLMLLKKDYHDHVTLYNRNYQRSMMELQKMRAINPIGVAPIQTNGWKVGDVKRLREPPPRKSKDDKGSKKTKRAKK